MRNHFLALTALGLFAAASQDSEAFNALHPEPLLLDGPPRSRFPDPPPPRRVDAIILDDEYDRTVLAQPLLSRPRPAASQVPLEWRVPCRRPDCAAPVGSPCKKSTLGRKFVHGVRVEDAKKLEEV